MTAPRFLEEVDVLSNGKLGHAYVLQVACPPIARAIRPGQFCNLYLSGLDSMLLLPRPFSIYRTDTDTGTLDFLYDVVGKGTARMSRLVPGDRIRIAGPLGNGFTIPDDVPSLIHVAGGIGSAPFLELMLKHPKKKHLMLFGGRDRNRLFGLSDFEGTPAEIRTATDDGSHGHHGLVTELLDDAVAAHPGGLLLACGPTPMLRAVGRYANARGLPCRLALEEQMGCGIGICRGCAVPVKSDRLDYEYAILCESGPVLDAARLYLEPPSSASCA